MRYTRYDLKKENGVKFFIAVLLMIFFLAFVIGTFVFKVIVKNAASFSSNNVKVSNPSNKYIKFVAVQGGIYKDKNNADAQKNLLSSYGIPFSIVDSDKTRVCIGVYTDENAKQIMDSLRKNNVDNTKIVFNVYQNDLYNVELIEIINANLKILNKLSESDVKSIKTDELKKWCASLKDVKGSNNDSKLILKEIKEYINKLPEEIEKKDGEQNYIYIFNILKKISEGSS
ncbi:SPOR domain-containing protein [Clostridium sp.]|jgi:nucleoside permease NupC|uniref:SPOR domain-containing protein n=1 Tax=Clostridium sp. TaxID=1506 RepID=UPI002FDCF723